MWYFTQAQVALEKVEKTMKMALSSDNLIFLGKLAEAGASLAEASNTEGKDYEHKAKDMRGAELLFSAVYQKMHKDMKPFYPKNIKVHLEKYIHYWRARTDHTAHVYMGAFLRK